MGTGRRRLGIGAMEAVAKETGSCVLETEKLGDISISRGFPTAVNDTTVAISSWDILLEARDGGARGEFASLLVEDSNSRSDSESSESEASSSLDRYRSCGSEPSVSCCTSFCVVDPSKLFSSTIAISRALERRLSLLCGSAGGFVCFAIDRPNIEASISLLRNSSTKSSKAS
jgi:hypothetical protein